MQDAVFDRRAFTHGMSPELRRFADENAVENTPPPWAGWQQADAGTEREQRDAQMLAAARNAGDA